tara:strand:+ start:552 stop:701 length:150 start_codon:yes stop_codon:yes gene_type:complete
MGKKKPIIEIKLNPDKNIEWKSANIGPGGKEFNIKKSAGWNAYMKNKKR